MSQTKADELRQNKQTRLRKAVNRHSRALRTIGERHQRALLREVEKFREACATIENDKQRRHED